MFLSVFDNANKIDGNMVCLSLAQTDSMTFKSNLIFALKTFHGRGRERGDKKCILPADKAVHFT